jgi:hypothetical protein
MVQEMGQEIGFLCSQESMKKLVSSDFAKILEYDSSNKNKRKM